MCLGRIEICNTGLTDVFSVFIVASDKTLFTEHS